MGKEYERAPSPGSNKVQRRKTESRAGIAGAIARERSYMREREERGPRPVISLPRLRFLEREILPPSPRELPPRRGRT
jgi:hypothetical protein